MPNRNKKTRVAANVPHTEDENVQVDFEGRNLEQQDFHGLKRLLQQVFLKEHVNLSELCDSLINQRGIGSVLKQSFEVEDEGSDDEGMYDNDDIYAVSSIFNLTSNKESVVVKQLIDLVQRVSKQNKSSEAGARLDSILNEDKKIGLIINERIVNLPAKIAEPMILSLRTELKRIQQRDHSYKFDYYVLICKTCKPKTGNQKYFVNSEEEIFSKASVLSFEYNVSSQCDSAFEGQWTEEDSEMVPYREIIFVPADKFDAAIENITKLFG